jgi:hypothetical protein
LENDLRSHCPFFNVSLCHALYPPAQYLFFCGIECHLSVFAATVPMRPVALHALDEPPRHFAAQSVIMGIGLFGNAIHSTNIWPLDLPIHSPSRAGLRSLPSPRILFDLGETTQKTILRKKSNL